MILDFITITGADDNTDTSFLHDMMTDYPFVEWGILFSKKRQGTPRYPSRSWIDRLSCDLYPKFDISFSAHLCGTLCEKLIHQHDYKTIIDDVPPLFARLQLNSFPELYTMTTQVNALASQLRETGIEIVLPIPNDTVLVECKKPLLPNVAFLYDGSRGLGLSPDKWPEVTLQDNAYVGFAGGINPDNIEGVIETLCGRPGDRHFWLDLESGARTEDQFDPRKVEKILQIAEKYASWH